MMRMLRADDLVGKTIVEADCDSTNAVTLVFEDETELVIWCEQAIHTAAGSIPGLFVEDTD